MQPHHPVAAASVEDDASSRQSSPSRPASPAQDQLPQEEEQVWHEDALPLSVTTKRNKVVLDLHTRLSSHFPSLFHQDVVDVPYYEEQPPAAPLLVLDPDLSKTWLRPPPKAGDTHGFWSPEDQGYQGQGCKLPPNRSHLYPPNTTAKPLSRAPYYHVKDEDLRRKFKAPTMGSVSLDLLVFDKGESSVGSSPLALLESHLRVSLLECYTSDAYLRIVYELAMCAAGTSGSVSREEALDLLPQVVRQSAMANSRCGQSLAAGYVGNVVALRDVVLDRFNTKQRTTNVLRGGDFSGPSLFGPLPESFASLLDTPQGAGYRCRSKPLASKSDRRTASSAAGIAAPAASTSGFKHPGSFVAAGSHTKRYKPTPSQPGKGAPFPKKPAGLGKYGRS